MKTGTVKTLGVAALGIAFAGAAAGSASAAPSESALPTLPGALPVAVPAADIVKALPLGQVSQALPTKTAHVVPGVMDTPRGLGTLLGGLPTGALPLAGALPLGG
jgi:hypothetical protein